MDTTEDDDSGDDRPSAAGTKPDDAMDDADDVRLSLFIISQRSGSLLGNFDQHENRFTILFYRVGRSDLYRNGGKSQQT